MTQHKILAHKITKPIQLLAAWLIGLAIIDIAFLTAASQITSPNWIPGFLAIAAVLHVPLFVISIFLLQTKFRPEMQEDAYYSDYLNRKNGKERAPAANKTDEKLEKKIEELSNKISNLAKTNPSDFGEQVRELISDEKIDELTAFAGDSRTLSELYLKPERWVQVVERWNEDQAFEDDLEDAAKHQFIRLRDKDPYSAELTDLGRKVAKRAEEEGALFAQINSNFFEKGGI